VRIRQFLDVLETWTGVRVDAPRLAQAVEDHNHERRLLAAVMALRRKRPARLTGRDALALLGVKGRLRRDEAKRLLGAVARSDDLPAYEGRRVFVTGSSHDSPDVYDAVEGNGVVIVGEDHDWGNLSVDREVDEPTVDGLARRYRDNGPTAHRGSMQRRAAHTSAAVERCEAELILGYWREHDEAPAWDCAYLAARLPAPFVEFGRQRYGQIDAPLSAVVCP
jgi:benzoyl-CoA reductase/2-hydroxyglutaryl-CoA dehydratase subunit BcrC/BadD/HgdB